MGILSTCPVKSKTGEALNKLLKKKKIWKFLSTMVQKMKTKKETQRKLFCESVPVESKTREA